MFIKSKKHGRKFVFYLIQSRRVGQKVSQFSLYLGDTLEMTASQWVARLARAKGFCPTIRTVGPVVQEYARRYNLQWNLVGIREAMRIESARSRPLSAHRTLGIQPGATRDQIRAAFRKLSQVHHPDHGGNPDEFKKLVKARDALCTPTSLQDVPLQVPK
jgi:DnaJ domain